MPCAAAVARVRQNASACVELQGVGAGTYIIVPLAGSISARKGAANITLCCRSSTAVSLSSIPELEPSKVREAWAAYALHRSEDEKEVGFACLQAGGPNDAGAGEVLLTRGGLQSTCLVVLAAAERGWMRAEFLPNNARCLRPARDGSVDWVGPGCAQVLQVIFFPLGATLSVRETFASQLALTTASSPPPPASKTSACKANADAIAFNTDAAAFTSLAIAADVAVERRHKPALGKAGANSLFAPFRIRPEVKPNEGRVRARRGSIIVEPCNEADACRGSILPKPCNEADDVKDVYSHLPPNNEPLPWVPECIPSPRNALLCISSVAAAPAQPDVVVVHL